MKDITGTYSLLISHNDDRWLSAHCYERDELIFVTCGRTEEELIAMIEDVFLDVFDIKLPWWKINWFARAYWWVRMKI
jgi:hypothetical protein